MVSQAVLGLVSCIKSAIIKGVDAKSAQQDASNRGHQFIGELRCSNLDDFYAGATQTGAMVMYMVSDMQYQAVCNTLSFAPGGHHGHHHVCAGPLACGP